MKRFFFYSAAAAALSLTLVAGGCTRKVYVPVENVRVVRDTVVRLLHDSLSNPGKAAAEVAAAMERKGDAMRKELEQRQEKEKRHSVVSAVAVLIFGAVAFSLGRRRG